MSAFSRLATVACATKRTPAFSGSKRGDPASYLTGLFCTPLDPLDQELRDIPNLRTPYEALQTFLEDDPDIVEGDILTVAGTDYNIRSVGDWVWRGDVYRHLVLEEIKNG